MKTKRCNYQFFAVFFITLSFLVIGCNKNDLADMGEDSESHYAKFYADSMYLEIKGDINDPKVIWDNMNTYSPAYERMRKHLVLKEGRLSWDIQNASTIKLSENVFKYIIDAWEQQNKKLESGDYHLEILDSYFAIISNADKHLSRVDMPHVSKRFPVIKNSEISFNNVFTVYQSIEVGWHYICYWVVCDKNLEPDNWGGHYVYGDLRAPFRQKKIKRCVYKSEILCD